MGGGDVGARAGGGGRTEGRTGRGEDGVEAFITLPGRRTQWSLALARTLERYSLLNWSLGVVSRAVSRRECSRGGVSGDEICMLSICLLSHARHEPRRCAREACIRAPLSNVLSLVAS